MWGVLDLAPLRLSWQARDVETAHHQFDRAPPDRHVPPEHHLGVHTPRPVGLTRRVMDLANHFSDHRVTHRPRRRRPTSMAENPDTDTPTTRQTTSIGKPSLTSVATTSHRLLGPSSPSTSRSPDARRRARSRAHGSAGEQSPARPTRPYALAAGVEHLRRVQRSRPPCDRDRRIGDRPPLEQAIPGHSRSLRTLRNES